MVSRFFLSLVFSFFTFTTAFAFHVGLSPDTVSPGDPFLITMTSMKNSEIPVAVLKKSLFPFTKLDEDSFLAIGAVDVKTKPGTYFLTVKNGKKKKTVKLTVKRTAFKTQKLTLPKQKVSLSRKDKQRVKQENRKLNELFSKVTERTWAGKFIIPLQNEISADFGTKRILNRKWKVIHKGLDIRGCEGDEVKAANDGTVVLAEELFYGGNTIILDHGQGIYTLYMHLSRFNVGIDEPVKKGDSIGMVGMTGRSTGPHLHFGVKIVNVNVNPVSFTELPL